MFPLSVTLKGKNMLPFGSIFFPLTVAPFKTGFSQRDSPPKLFYLYRYQHIMDESLFTYCKLNSKLYFTVFIFLEFC